jgi:hypothetical protein
LLFTRGWVTFVQPFPLPEILTSKLAEGFGFLKTLPLDYPPKNLPAVKPVGQLSPIARSERLGLDDRHAALKELYRCIAPHYPVQIAPEMGIEFHVDGLQFSETKLRVYIHTFGLVLSLQTLFQVAPGSAGLTGSSLAGILNKLERIRGICGAIPTLKPKCVLNFFDQLRRLIVSRVFSDKISTRADADVFCVFSPEGGEFPTRPDGVPDGQPDRLALFSALERYTRKEYTNPFLGNKCFTTETGGSGAGVPPGWIFGSQKGVALFDRPGEDNTRATLARRCHHKNVARLIGWYQLYQAYLAEQAESRGATDRGVLQHAVKAYDTMAVKYSRVWIRWARQRFRLDEPVKAVVEAYGLVRKQSPDDHVAPMNQVPPDFEVTPLLNFDTFPSALCLAMPGQVEPLVTFSLRNSTSEPVEVQLTSELRRYAEKQALPVTVMPRDTKFVDIKVSLIAERVKGLKTAENSLVSVTWTVDKSGGVLTPKEQTFDITVLEKDYFVFARRHKGQQAFVNCSWLIAAWIDREDPEVIALRRSAASKNNNSMPGYPEGGGPAAAQVVLAQVKALYDAVHEKNLAYGNRTRPQYQDDKSHAQTVRLPGKSITDGVMNCLDGAVLFGSLLFSCDLAPGILFIPGHAMVGWKQSESPASDWDFIEITDVVESDFLTALENGRKTYNAVQERVVVVRDLQPPEIKELDQAHILVDIRDVKSAGVKTLQ